MRSDVARDLTKSSEVFVRLIWPVVSPLVDGGELVPVESVTAEGFAKQLDVLAGMDAWQVKANDGMRGIASRVQYIKPGARCYDTFTIRRSRRSGAETEFDKRVQAIGDVGPDGLHRGWIFPALTVQGFVDTGAREALSAGVVQTANLIRYVDANKDDWSRVRIYHTPSGESFYAVGWGQLRKDGVPVKVWRSEERRAA